jgi:FAD/FMN-containing dehydrogenase
MKQMHRKKFLQLALLSPIGLAGKPLQAFANDTVNRAAATGKINSVLYYKPGDPEYELLRKGFNKRIDKFPAIIALCKSTAEVAEAILYASKNNLPIAVKSGGHCMEGFSANNGGMVINLSALKNIEWLNRDTIKVEPGCTLRELYATLLPKKKIIPGGSCAGVGIGGLVLGGGYGLMARKFGLTCDSLLGVTMVDGTGKIISSGNDNDLLWASRGGNNGNFGVATELIFKVHTAPSFMQSFRFRAYKIDTKRAKDILQKWFELTAALPVDCFSAFVLNGKTLYILLTNTGKHTERVQEAISGLKAITDKTSSTQPQPLARALKVYYGRQQPLYFKNASAGLYKNFADIAPLVDKVLELVLSAPGMIYQVNTLGGNIQDTGLEKASAFPHRAYSFFSELQAYWETPGQQTRLAEKFQQVQQLFTSNGIVAQYRNYPDINFTNPGEMYYGENYKRLQQLKNKYDPDNLFRYEQSIKNG